MAKPIKVHTLESLYEMTQEDGDCRVWTGYMGNGTPMVYVGGKMYSVRKLILELAGKYVRSTNFFSCSCGTAGCVELDHIVQRPLSHHVKIMSKNSSNVASDPARRAKIARAKRKTAKLTVTDAAEIRLSDKSGPELAEEYGVSRSMVNHIKKGRSWAVGNMWQGLMR